MRFVTRSVVATLVVAGASAAACGGDEKSSGGPIETGLRRIPLEVYDEALDEGRGSIEVTIADVEAIAELRDLDAPEPGREPDDVANWLLEISGFRDERPEIDALPMREPPLFETPPDVFDDELGIDVGAITAWSGLVSLPIAFAVFDGEVSLSPSLEDVGDDVVSTRDDDDYMVDPAARGVDLLGRPVRAAALGGQIAVSLTHDLVAGWVAGGEPTLAEEEQLLQVARRLDAAGASSAYIVETDFSVQAFPSLEDVDPAVLEAQLEDPEVIEAPFDVVGVGAAEVDGAVSVIAVYAFEDDQDAEDSTDRIEELWEDSELIGRPGVFIDDEVDLTSVERTDNTVVVVAEMLERSPVLFGARLILERDPLFAHR